MKPDGIGLGFVPRPGEHVVAEAVDAEVVLYHESNGSMHLLNSTAAVVWALSDGTRDLARVITDIGAAYDLDPAAIGDEIRELIREMGRQGLLEGVEA